MFCFVLNVTVLGILFSNNNHEFHTFNADIQHTYKNGTIFLFSDGAKKNIYAALKNLHPRSGGRFHRTIRRTQRFESQPV